MEAKQTITITLNVPAAKYYKVKHMADEDSKHMSRKRKKTIHDKFIEILNKAI